MNTTLLYPVPDPQAISREMDGETILVLPQQGKVNVLNELGQFVWSRVDGTQSVEEIVSAVCNEYDVTQDQARQDVLSFLQLLAEKGALQLENRPG